MLSRHLYIGEVGTYREGHNKTTDDTQAGW